MKLITLSLGAIVFMGMTSSSLKLDPTEETGFSYQTVTSETPSDLVWNEIGKANELVNIKTQIVVISGGENPISEDEWQDFEPGVPWIKNIGRNLVFDSASFYRSPGLEAECSSCFTEVEYQDYTWTELAETIGMAYVPGETDILEPEEGYLVIKTIQKCQVVKYNTGTTIYELTDNRGNYYVMHATENGDPTLDVVLPEGWSIESRILTEQLILKPFGGGDECYYNVVGDHLGQGYHQYKYASDVYPSE
jgi:hypothetical protein